jgi:hypothetical protein
MSVKNLGWSVGASRSDHKKTRQRAMALEGYVYACN